MTLRSIAISAALIVSAFAPAAALACPLPGGQPPSQPSWAVPAQQGHYETRNEPQWVEGRYDQRWIDGRCYEARRWGRGWGFGRHGRLERCTPGHYESVWVPGHYEQVPRTVWVADLPEPLYGMQP